MWTVGPATEAPRAGCVMATTADDEGRGPIDADAEAAGAELATLDGEAVAPATGAHAAVASSSASAAPTQRDEA